MHRKRNFKIKLIVPCRFETYNSYSYYSAPFLPYGMGVLSNFLKQHNYYVEQEDLSIRFNRRNSLLSALFKNRDLDIFKNMNEIRGFFESGEIKGKLSALVDKMIASTPIEGFDIIGFSIFSFFSFISALMLAKRIKQKTDTPIVFGGPFIGVHGQLYPQYFNFIDYMIVGDGRMPLLKLIQYLQKKIAISEIPNLIYKKNGQVVSNCREYYPLEDSPVPDFDGLPIDMYKSAYGSTVILPYQASGGCTNRCGFCTHIWVKKKLEFKSHDKVIRELRQMQEKYKSSIFYFCDEAINNSYHYLEELCDLFIKNRLNIYWSVYAKVGNLNRYILKKMKEAGCYLLLFGIESGSDRILEMMNKGFISEQARTTLIYSSEAGLRNEVFFIAGFPHETQEDINQTAEFIKKNKKYIHCVQIYRFELCYGSLMYFNPEKYGITNLSPDRLLPYRFTFDESNGLKWQEKQKQQEDSKRQIIKAWQKNTMAFNVHKFNKILNLHQWL